MTHLVRNNASERLSAPPAKASYHSPSLLVLGNLRSATRGSGGMGADGALGMTMMSDRAVKKDVVRIGKHPLGLGLYLFRYEAPHAERYGAGRRIGFMADEVAELYPHAVSRDADGRLMVDYGRLPR